MRPSEPNKLKIYLPTDACIFCQIARGDVFSHGIYTSERVIAFLDINPIRQGHVQIIPREHFDCFDDLPCEIACEIMTVGQQLARALKRIYDVKRVAFLFAGGDVAHAHAHLVPMMEHDDITSRRYILQREITYRDMPRISDDELAQRAIEIRSALKQRARELD